MTRTAVAGACFERTLLARPGQEADTSTRVTWIQGEHLYCDLRQPADLAVRRMRDTTLDDLLALAQQEGFAGPLLDRGDHVEWVRTVSFHPLGSTPDAGTLAALDDRTLAELGVFDEYIEHWHCAARSSDIEEYMIENVDTGTFDILVRVGDRFGFARGRAAESDATPLADRIRDAANPTEARSLLDCEISIGTVFDGQWTISASTLPHRVGTTLDPATARSSA